MIGRMHHVVLDCPDPAALAAFYSALLGLPVTYRDSDWVVVAANDTSRVLVPFSAALVSALCLSWCRVCPATPARGLAAG